MKIPRLVIQIWIGFSLLAGISVGIGWYTDNGFWILPFTIFLAGNLGTSLLVELYYSEPKVKSERITSGKS